MNSAEIITMKEYFSSLLREEEKARLAAQYALEKRLDGMNEIRETMRDQASKFPTRDELVSSLRVIEADLRVLRDFKSTLEGKASQSAVNMSLIIAGIGILFSIVSLIKDFIK